MIAARVGAEVVASRDIGVADRDVAVLGFAARLRGPEQQLKVHHVVDDDGEGPLGASVPRFDAADVRIEPTRERLGPGEKHLAVVRIGRNPPPLAKATEQHEAHVMSAPIALHRFEPGGVGRSGDAPRGIVSSAINHNAPGKKPLVQSAARTHASLPRSKVRG